MTSVGKYLPQRGNSNEGPVIDFIDQIVLQVQFFEREQIHKCSRVHLLDQVVVQTEHAQARQVPESLSI